MLDDTRLNPLTDMAEDTTDTPSPAPSEPPASAPTVEAAAQEPTPAPQQEAPAPPPAEGQEAPPAAPMPEATTEAEGKADAPEPAAAQEQGILTFDEAGGKDAFWERILTGDLETVPDTIRIQAGMRDMTLDTEEQAYRLAQTINRSWLADNRGLEREDVRANWPAYRNKLAGELGVGNDETEVFYGLSIRQKDSARREAARKIYRNSYQAGLLGHDYKDDTETLDSLEPEDRAAADALGVGAYQEGADLRARWLPLVERTAQGIDMFAGMEEEVLFSPRTFAGMPELVAALDELSDLKPEDQQLVIYLACDLARKKRISGKGGESLPYRLYRAQNRGIANIALGLTQSVHNLGVTTLDSIGNALGGDTGRALRREAEAWDRRGRMATLLGNISQQELSPLYPADGEKKAENYLIDAAESTPAAILSFCGPYGLTALTFSSIGHSTAEARLRAPEGKQQTQLCAGISAGIAQAGIYMALSRIGGKMLENAISGFAKSRGAGAAAFSMGSLKTAGAASLHGAELWAAGKLSEAADLGSQELAARLSGTASNIDWESYGDNIMDIDANMHEAASLLPFLLIGSGRVSLHHFRSPKTLLKDGEPLREWGIDEPTCREIMAAKDIQTQGVALRTALRKSPRWSDPDLVPQAIRAMQLLNADYFKGFNQEEAVRDFLQLPAESAKIKTKEPVVRTEEEVKDLPEHVYDRRPGFIKKNARYAGSMELWDSWWQQSHIASYVAPYYKAFMGETDKSNPRSNRSAAYQIILNGGDPPVPTRMRNSGIYAPRSEAERRALLRDTVQEAKDLSYQFLMCAYPLDSLVKNSVSLQRTGKDAENARKRLLGQVGKAVMDIALGAPCDTALRDLRQYMANYIKSRNYRGASIGWTKDIGVTNLLNMPDMIQDYDNYQLADNYEMREVLRVMGGMSACAYRLVNLLPMVSDFSTALTRGMSPAQAYHHLLQRELDNTAENAVRYPFKAIEESAAKGDMERFCAMSRSCYDQMLSLTGHQLEQTAGDDGTPHWRAATPDGNLTRWHLSEQDAINDLAINTAPYFSPMGEGYFHWLRFFGGEPGFDINERPTSSYEEFCGFDQLAGIALKDLKDYLYASPTRLQPGHSVQNLRTFLRGHRSEDPVRVQTEAPERTPYGDTVVDSLSIITPYSLTESRLLTFWKRMLDSRFISADRVEDFLETRGLLTPGRRDKLEGMTIPLPYPKSEDTPLRETPPPNIGGRNQKLAKLMADYHTVFYFSDLENRNVPESVRHWFNLVPFCPPLPEEQYASPVAPYVSRRIPMGPDGRTALAWSNRMTAMKLNARAADFRRVRQEMQDSPLPEDIAELFRLADQGSQATRFEQGWCYHQSGAGVFYSTPQNLWNLLQFPRRAWEVMPPEERTDLTRRVYRAVKDNPAISALDAEGRGESPDFVEHAILNLDNVLLRFPDLHRYAPIQGSDSRVCLLELQDSMPRNTAREAPLTDAVGLYLDTGINGRNISQREVAMPEELKTDPEALHALQFLNVLRATTAQRPYVQGDTIWWKHEPYGGMYGKRPLGLNGWKVASPMPDLFRLLRDIHSQNTEEGKDSMDVCGIRMRGADWHATNVEGLSTVTVYRCPQNLARTYRLMPGFPQSTSMDVRTPYFVLCHNGVYYGDDKLIDTPQELYASYHPLELFEVKPDRYTADSHLDPWRRMGINHTLDALAAWPERAQELVEDGYSGVHGLNELVLRLCEDTCFSYMLRNTRPETLSPAQARVVNIAYAAMECMQEPDSREALQGLAKAMAPLVKHPKLREEVIAMLIQCEEEVRQDKTKMGIVNDAFSEALDENLRKSARKQEFDRWYDQNFPASVDEADEP